MVSHSNFCMLTVDMRSHCTFDNYPRSQSWQLSPAAEAEVAVVLLLGGLATVQQTGAEVAAEAEAGGPPFGRKLRSGNDNAITDPAGSTDATS